MIKKKSRIVEVKVADHRQQFHLSVPRGPGRISAALLSCSEVPLPAKSELSKFEMKELLLGEIFKKSFSGLPRDDLSAPC